MAVGQQSGGGNGAPAPVAGPPVKHELVRRALDDSEPIDLHVLLEVACWQRSDDAKLREQFNAYYAQLLTAFKNAHHQPQLAVFPSIGAAVFMSGTGPRMDIEFSTDSFGFDWSAALEVLSQLTTLEDDVHVWLHEQSDRIAVMQRIYLLATRVVGAISERFESGKAPFRDRMKAAARQIEVIERELDAAAKRSAQWEYAKGMLAGLALVGALTGVIAGVFALTDVHFLNLIALPAGAIGAFVSVMQRMSNGKLRIDYRAAGRMLFWFGAARPVLGAIFGMVLFGLVAGNVLPWIAEPAGIGALTAFFATLGFLSGFNERFAQDMLGRATDAFQPPPAQQSAAV